MVSSVPKPAPTGSEPRLLRGFGFNLVSDLAIPGAVPLGRRKPVEPIRITACRGALSKAPLYRISSQELHFACPGIADYRIEREAIHVTAPAPLNAEVAALLIATALPGLLWMRGRFVLHAAGLVLGRDESVVALAGSSGAGKSTVAAHLIAKGARLVGDDTLAIEFDEGTVRASGLAGGQFLRRQSDRRFQPLPAASRSAGGKLAGIILLDSQVAVDSTPRQKAVDAVQALLHHRHRPAIPDLLGLRSQVMQQAVEIVRHVPVIAWNPHVDGRCWSDELGAWLSVRLRGEQEE